MLELLLVQTNETIMRMFQPRFILALEDDDSVVEELVGRIGQLHLRTQEIRREAEQLEDPLQRQVQLEDPLQRQVQLEDPQQRQVQLEDPLQREVQLEDPQQRQVQTA